jgi:hypothetical protein
VRTNPTQNPIPMDQLAGVSSYILHPSRHTHPCFALSPVSLPCDRGDQAATNGHILEGVAELDGSCGQKGHRGEVVSRWRPC